MKILISSHFFYPMVGGIETMSLLLAQNFVRRGHDVVVVTYTPNLQSDKFPFTVIRSPNARKLLEIVSWCDVYLQNNISLKTLWPLLLIRRPCTVAHHTWIRRTDGSIAWQDRLKRWLLRYSKGISVSEAIADDISTESTIIGNAYREEIFRRMANVKRDCDLVFLGRLVSDKGPLLIVEALGLLAAKGLKPTVTFIGTGPELESLQQAVMARELDSQVTFAGNRVGVELANLLNRHHIMVVPSVWNEPFGIVALEGIACGCVVVGSEGGGLKDAIGPCGVTFPNGDAQALADALESLLLSSKKIHHLIESSPQHLATHTVDFVGGRYLDVLNSALESRQ